VSLKGESPTFVLGGANGDGGRSAGGAGSGGGRSAGGAGSPFNGLAGAAAGSVVLGDGSNGGGDVKS
jgi:hypothetical protein